MKNRYPVICMLWFCCAAHGQPAATPATYEVAAIKPSDATRSPAISRSGRRMNFTNVSLQWLILWAWDVPADRLYGVPKWLDSDRFDIAANAPEVGWQVKREPGQPSELQKMMQELLAERFGLVLHRESRQLALYALVVAKGGPKVHMEEVKTDFGQNPFHMPGRGRLVGTGVTTEMLAKALTDQVGRFVRDETGLDGIFDLTLEWEPDPPPEGADGAPTSTVRTRPPLFAAIQEQLGFRLEPRKGPVEVLVIDRVERTPTEN